VNNPILYRRARSGQVALFILATLGITITAGMAIYEAYQKFILEKRDKADKAEISRLRSELDQTKAEVRTAQIKLREELSQEEILESAQILRSPRKRTQSSQDKIPSPAERRITQLTQATQVLDSTLKTDDHVLRAIGFDPTTIQLLRRDLPTTLEDLKDLDRGFDRGSKTTTMDLLDYIVKSREDRAKGIEDVR
jgi:hypothetical protein